MARRGRQVQLWLDDDTYEAISDLAVEADVRVVHVLEALGRLVRDTPNPQRRTQLTRIAREVKAEREARSGHTS